MVFVPRAILLLTVLLLLAQTAGAQPAPGRQVETLGDAQRTGRGGNMVEILRDIAVRYTNDPANPFASIAQVKLFAEMVKTKPNMETYLSLYQSMVNAGMSAETVKGVTEMLARPGLDSAVRLRFLRLLGIAYLRLGEQDNCVGNHTSQSCLFPIQKGGVHSIQRGSRNAIEVYSTILRLIPNDHRARWLLNVAYMTLGEYPDKVPPEWLLAPSLFASDYPLPPFTNIAPSLGLDMEGLAGGICMEDFDRDGDLDLLTSAWGAGDPMHFFRNNGDGTFTERASEAGLDGIIGGLSMTHADYNNDGYPDVYITRGAWLGLYGKQPGSLLHNNGDGTFTDVTIAAGLLSFRPTLTSAWADFDNDGWVDLMVGAETGANLHPCELYRNNGNGTFTNVAHQVGLDIQGVVKAVVWGDYNNDGFIDLYISCLGGVNSLMRNNGPKEGKWSFTDVAAQAGVQQPIFSFPAFFFDYNNDGCLDIFVSDYGGLNTGTLSTASSVMSVLESVVSEYMKKPIGITMAKLYHNNGNGTFTDVTVKMHLNRTLFAMGMSYGDVDNDGWMDIYAGTGTPDLEALVPNRMFRNAGGKCFQDVTTSAGVGHLQKGHGIAFGDIDNDGDQDIFEVMGGAVSGDRARSVVFQNPGNKNHWITLLLEGVKANRFAIGARIKVTVQCPNGKHRDIHVMAGTAGSFGSSSLQQEIGLGDARRIKSITIVWPGSQTKQVITNVGMDRVLQVREGNNDIAMVERRPIVMPKPGAPTHQHDHDHHGHH